MILHFPDYKTLCFTIMSGLIPDKMQAAPAKAAWGDVGDVYIKTPRRFARGGDAALLRLGVRRLSNSPLDWQTNVTSWQQLVQLESLTNDHEVNSRTTVLFVLADDRQLPELVDEMLRQGNDRQSYRFVTDGSRARILLRVIGPPYYSLLRALESDHTSRESDDGIINNRAHLTSSVPIAYVEQSPRVWVQFGFQHPLAGQIKPPTGQMLLLTAPREWLFLTDAPFEDIYQKLDFQLPSEPVVLNDRQWDRRINTPLKLTAGSANDVAELWVLRVNAVEQVAELVRNSDDQLLSQLAFAVSEKDVSDDASPTVVLRLRPSKKTPPVLVLNAIAYRSYLKLPNLFVPVGQRLHPPLRRDAVAKLLASDQSLITWLEPAENGVFTPRSFSDSAFLALNDWIEYVLDRQREPLNAWMNSFQFEFDSFICIEDQMKHPVSTEPRRNDDEGLRDFSASGQPSEVADTETEETQASEFTPVPAVIPKPDKLQVRLSEVETKFIELQEPLDSDVRRHLWKEMAVLNSQMQRPHDSTVCWSNVFWERDRIDARSANDWLVCEQQSGGLSAIDIENIEARLAERTAPSGIVGLIVAYLVWAAAQDHAPAGLRERIGYWAQLLQRQESRLPVRTAWLAWHAIYKLSDDVLGLARARDRILERLFQSGLAPDFDLPSFLRTVGHSDRDRLRALGEQLLQICRLAEDWLLENPLGDDPQTKLYANLSFAFGLARLGEVSHCKHLSESALRVLSKKDQVHFWLGMAYDFRIEQALNGDTNLGQLSQELLELAAGMDRMNRYKVDRLRQQSRILEPHERINAFSRWHKRYADELSQELAELPNLLDRQELAENIQGLMARYPAKSSQHTRVLAGVLELCVRLGDSYTAEIVGQTMQALKRCDDSVEKASLLQKAICVSAHFGHADAVESLVSTFKRALPEIVSGYLELPVLHNPDNKQKLDTIESLFKDAFRSLRKLGMREQIGDLYGDVAKLIRKAEPQGRKKRKAANADEDADIARPLRLLLCVATGWFYFGQTKRAVQVADEVREILFKGDLPPIEQKNLACAYVQAVAHAPTAQAFARIAELLQRNAKGVRNLANLKDNMTTSSHYSILQLELIESVVTAMVGDEYTFNSESRRWLDEDEFLVRRRIHHDVAQALKRE